MLIAFTKRSLHYQVVVKIPIIQRLGREELHSCVTCARNRIRVMIAVEGVITAEYYPYS